MRRSNALAIVAAFGVLSMFVGVALGHHEGTNVARSDMEEQINLATRALCFDLYAEQGTRLDSLETYVAHPECPVPELLRADVCACPHHRARRALNEGRQADTDTTDTEEGA